MMSTNLYSDIMKTIRAQANIRDCQTALEEKYPTVSTLALGSILSSHVQKKMRMNHGRYNVPEKMQEFYMRFKEAVEHKEPPGIILRIADEIDICPVLVARFVLEAYIRDQQEKELQKYASKVSDAEDKIQNEETQVINLSVIRSEVNRLLKDNTAIEDRDLAYEVFLCTVHDDHYGPMPDSIKQSIGQEYEAILKHKLTELKIWFVDEGILRQQGYDKTPDFKLDVPIAIEGRVVNWIESKALFGDEDTHNTYLDEQLISYRNRFGPGLVIYWLGYIETLESQPTPGIFIRDHLPVKIVFMDPKADSSSETKPVVPVKAGNRTTYVNKHA